MAIHFAVGFALLQASSIGSALSDDLRLVYESGGVAQAPWVYDSVRIVERDGFDRCVIVAIGSMAPRESCARRDSLFTRNAAGAFVATRPIGAHMELAVPAAGGNVLHYRTGEPDVQRVAGGLEVSVLPTTIVTRDAAGAIIRRLREGYAPALLTAVWGVFEEPDGAGGWTTVREFRLSNARRPAAPLPSGDEVEEALDRGRRESGVA
jgi:hypothetical protein